jgi:hypothetical protein
MTRNDILDSCLSALRALGEEECDPRSLRVVCSNGCAFPQRDPDQEHPGVCICGGYLTDVSATIY